MNDLIEVKTTELTGSALDWITAKTMNLDVSINMNVPFGNAAPDGKPFIEYYEEEAWPGADSGYMIYSPSTNWAQGGPIIEKEKIALQWIGYWDARCDRERNNGGGSSYAHGHTPLIALLRAIISAKIGNTVKVPAELVNNSVNNDNI